MKVTYYELDKREIGKETEKAIGIITGTGANTKATYKYIAKSLIKEVENKLYIPTWIVRQEGLWDYIKEENQIQIENGKKSTRRSAEQIIIDTIKKLKENKNLENDYIITIQLNGGYSVRKAKGQKQIDNFINSSIDYDCKEDECILVQIVNDKIESINKSNEYITESKEAEKVVKQLNIIYQ